MESRSYRTKYLSVVSISLVLLLIFLAGCQSQPQKALTEQGASDDVVLEGDNASAEDSEEYLEAEEDYSEPSEKSSEETDKVQTSGSDVTQTSDPDVTFALTGKNFKFSMDGKTNPDLRVSVGDLVRIEFTSTEGLHDFVLNGYSVATSRVSDGESTFVEFVADKAGTFEYYCSVNSHRAQGMKGALIVE